jgi:uncharacterized damage-inducible protein DinB
MREEIAHAAAQFNVNSGMLTRVWDGLTAEEWSRRPCETTNSLQWIVGHILWARSRCARMLGSKWERDWVKHFERGSKPGDRDGYPAVDELLAAWQEVTAELTSGLESATEETLEREAHRPSLNGKVSGMVDFLVVHEAYHVGQAAYVRCWLGKGGAMG